MKVVRILRRGPPPVPTGFSVAFGVDIADCEAIRRTIEHFEQREADTWDRLSDVYVAEVGNILRSVL